MIYWFPQKENKDTRYAKKHKETMAKYGIGRSRWWIGPKKYTGNVKLNTGKIITKLELVALIKRLL
jgi:hypothetical protein